ncbi:VOC family protein [Cellulosimicrobium protaetiae]|uniref:Glyoxalase n=1 Tax=Cellulosimicrobium protaetiae TaxID=2587808 RepID=A0A6M5UDB1_9MICO|nr:VOC family protein [Cellulosimicrobium protaetiae]QJW35153.1 glyoxalase [Cellulosimicrobium protaetiae]
MSTTTPQAAATTAPTPPPLDGELRIEVVVVPVSDVDVAKEFYAGTLGWRLDADFTLPDGLSVVQVTPPGSPTSVIFGRWISAAAAGGTDGLVLAVRDVEQARTDLAERGVDVSEVFHDAVGAFHRAGEEGRVAGPDPERRSYASWASFQDPDGNRWYLQEVRERRPGR